MKLGQIIWALRRSRIRREIVQLLCTVDEPLYASAIADLIKANYVNVIGALRGLNGRYASSESLIGIGIVKELKIGNHAFYLLTNKEICKILNELGILKIEPE
jgi:predicted transcriptional regulator with HTH domain